MLTVCSHLDTISLFVFGSIAIIPGSVHRWNMEISASIVALGPEGHDYFRSWELLQQVTW